MIEKTVIRSGGWVVPVIDDPGTASSSVTPAVIPPSTRTAAAHLTEGAGALRHKVNTLAGDIRDTHRRTFDHEWSVLAQQRGAQAPVALLDELGELGFAWRDVARLLSVSVPAVKKWRSGESISGPNRGKLVKLVAACDFLTDHYHVEDIASWFEMPLRDDVPVTPIHLWISGRPQLFFDYGTRHATADATLDALDPEWRDRYRTDVRPFRDADGNLGLRIMDR